MHRPLLLGISEAARRAGVSEGTLRDYELRGIIHPQRDSAGRRIFTETEIKQARDYRQKQRLPQPL